MHTPISSPVRDLVRLPRLAAWLLALAGLLAPAAVVAAPPVPLLPVVGSLRTPGGGPVTDGKYSFVARLYDGPGADAKLLWSEAHVGVAVQGGAFSAVLGGSEPATPLPPSLFVAHPQLWFTVSVQGEPELPRVPVLPVAFAHQAGHAETAAQAQSAKYAETAGSAEEAKAAFTANFAKGLACTGCVGLQEIAPAVLDASKHAASYAGQATHVQAALDDLAGRVGTYEKAVPVVGGKVGLGVDAPQCPVDLGDACYKGQAARMVVAVADGQAMQAIETPGAMVYRKDQDAFFGRTVAGWRRVLLEAFCGDGYLEGAEQCDDGKANADAPDKCRTDCTKPICGDQITDTGEQCDDANQIATDACISCKAAVCGDGHLQAGVEQCDDGAANADAPDKCRKSCKKPACGDKIVDSGEQCDDGNLTPGDGCSVQCQNESPCPAGTAYVNNYCWVRANAWKQTHQQACAGIGKNATAKSVPMNWNNTVLTQVAAAWGFGSIGDYDNSATAMWCNPNTKQCGTHNWGSAYDNYGPYGDSNWWPVYTCVP